jgi:acyl carrier protein
MGLSVEEQVRAIIADVLGQEPEAVGAQSRLMGDLGAESLDFLDIVFRLEDEFEIKIPRGEIEKNARGPLSEEEFAPGGIVSEAGLERLRALLPEVAGDIKPGLRAAMILSLFTVETFCKIVSQKLAQKVGA